VRDKALSVFVEPDESAHWIRLLADDATVVTLANVITDGTVVYGYTDVALSTHNWLKASVAPRLSMGSVRAWSLIALAGPAVQLDFAAGRMRVQDRVAQVRAGGL
jgi:hypothetical protein